VAKTLATEPRPEARRPSGLIGMAVLVLACELYAAHRGRDLTTVWASAWEASGRAAYREGGRAEVLCLGDSLVKYGVAPRVIESVTGRTAYNLAVYNGQAPASYFLLRRALDSGGRPAAVLVDGEVLDYDPRTYTRLWADMLGTAESLELAWEARDASFLGAVTLARCLPSYKARFEVRAAVLAALRGEPWSPRNALRLHRRNWERNLGAHVEPADSAASRRIAGAVAASDYLPASWACHPINRAFVHKMMRLAEARGVPVYWLLPPLHPDVQERRDRGGMHGQYVRFVRGLQDRYTNLTVVDARHAGYGPEALADLTHMNRLGAERFSSEVAAVLRDRLGGAAGPRWVEPRPGAPPAPPSALEDLEQSRTALGRIRSGRVR
jgi:hypothetical protein